MTVYKIAITSLLAATLTASTALAADPIKIGALLPLSGNYGFLGVSERYGIEMAVKEVNEAGGILGRQVEVLYEDAGNPAQTTRKAEQLKEKGVTFYVNGGGSAVSAAAADFAARSKLIDLAMDPNAEELVSTKANKYFFLVPPPSSMIANAIGPHVAKLGKSVFYLTHDYSFGHAQTAQLRRVLENVGGTTEAGEIKVPLNTRDFSAQIIAIRNAKPDIVVINVAGADASALFEQIHEFGLNNDVKVVAPLLDFEESWAIGAEKNQIFALAGTEWHYTLDAPGVKDFTQRFQTMFPKADYPVPTTNVVNAYLSVRETLQAIERAKSTDSDAIITALEEHETKDSLKKTPVYIRSKDHQWVQDFLIVRPKPVAEMKEPSDIYEILSVAPGKDIVIPEDQSKADLKSN